MLREVIINIYSKLKVFDELNLTIKRLIYIACFVSLCLIDQVIGSATGYIQYGLKNYTGIIIAVIILTAYNAKDFLKIPYFVWIIVFFITRFFLLDWLKDVIYNDLEIETNIWGIGIYGIVLIRMIYLFCVEKKKPSMNWASFCVWLTMIVGMVVIRSEFAWSKALLGAFLCFYLTEFKKKDLDNLYAGMVEGIILGFIIIQGHAWLYRPYDSTDFRYLGMYSHPNMNALLYLCTYCAVLSKWYLMKLKKTSILLRLPVVLLAGLIIGTTIFTGSRTTFFTIGVVTVIFLGFQIVSCKKKRMYEFCKDLIILVIAVIVCFFPAYCMIRYLPAYIDNPIYFESDNVEEKIKKGESINSEKYVEIDEALNIMNSRFFWFTDKGWKQIGEHYYYILENGSFALGLQEIDDKLYYFGNNGIVKSGIYTIGDEKYYFGDDGSAQYGFVDPDNGYIYYLEEGGEFYSGLVNIKEKYYYFTQSGAVRIGWHNIEGNIYYFDEKDYSAVTGNQIIDGVEYIFNDEGILQTERGWKQIDGFCYYILEDGSFAKDLQIIDGKTYYFGDNGIMKKGVYTFEERKYYFGDDGSAQYGFVNANNGYTYYFGENGVYYKGLKEISGKLYYFTNEGIVQTGWHIVNGNKYYFSKENYAALVGKNIIDGVEVLFDENGKLLPDYNAKGNKKEIFFYEFKQLFNPGLVAYAAEWSGENNDSINGEMVVPGTYSESPLLTKEERQDPVKIRIGIFKYFIGKLRIIGCKDNIQGVWISNSYYATHTHNIFLQMAYDFGIIIGIIFIIITILLFRKILCGLRERIIGFWYYRLFVTTLFGTILVVFGMLEINWIYGQLPFTMFWIVQYLVYHKESFEVQRMLEKKLQDQVLLEIEVIE